MLGLFPWFGGSYSWFSNSISHHHLHQLNLPLIFFFLNPYCRLLLNNMTSFGVMFNGQNYSYLVFTIMYMWEACKVELHLIYTQMINAMQQSFPSSPLSLFMPNFHCVLNLNSFLQLWGHILLRIYQHIICWPLGNVDSIIHIGRATLL